MHNVYQSFTFEPPVWLILLFNCDIFSLHQRLALPHLELCDLVLDLVSRLNPLVTVVLDGNSEAEDVGFAAFLQY